MTKIEIGETRPDHFVEDWPEQYRIFSHLEFTSGVPSPIFLVTTVKENGKPNACVHAWSAFSGDVGGFFAVMTGLMKSTHTYRNILRDREFCVNFLSPAYYDACMKTIERNGEDDDEFQAGGFTAESAKTIKCPRIKEAFLTYECTLESESDLSGAGVSSMVIGRVRHAAVNDGFSTVQGVCSEDAFTFNIHCPKDPRSGDGKESAVAKLQFLRSIG